MAVFRISIFFPSFCDKESQGLDSSNNNKIPLVNQLTFLGQSFSRLVDVMLGHLIQKIGKILLLLKAALMCLPLSVRFHVSL